MCGAAMFVMLCHDCGALRRRQGWGNIGPRRHVRGSVAPVHSTAHAGRHRGANPVHAWNAAVRHPPHEASETGIRHRCRPTREKRSRVGHVRVETVVLMLEPVALSAADAIHAVTRSCVSSAAARTTKSRQFRIMTATHTTRRWTACHGCPNPWDTALPLATVSAQVYAFHTQYKDCD